MSSDLFTPHDPDFYAQKDREKSRQDAANRQAEKAAIKQRAISSQPGEKARVAAEAAQATAQRAAQAQQVRAGLRG